MFLNYRIFLALGDELLLQEYLYEKNNTGCHNEMSNNVIRHRLILPALILIGILVYANAITNGFLYDDFVDLKAVKQYQNPAHLPLLFVSDTDRLYRPLKYALYVFDYWVWGLRPFGCHLTNIILHLLCCAAVYLLIRRITTSYTTAFWVSLFFLIHPVQTESVTWVASRGSPASTLFFLLALLLFLRAEKENRFRWTLLSVLAFYFALLAKEMAVTLPFILVAYILLFRRREYGFRKVATRLAPFVGVIFFYGITRTLILKGVSQEEPLPHHLAIAFSHLPIILWRYIGLLFFPLRLCADYQITPFPQWNAEFYLAALGWLLTFVFLFRMGRNRPLLAFFALWFFITLLPVINLVPINAFMAERFLYLPSIGFWGFWAALADERLKGRMRIIMAIIAACVALLFAVRTIIRNADWESELTLWSYEAKVHPANFNLHHLYAEALARAGKFENARIEYKRAIALAPDYALAHIGLGQVLVKLDDLEAAERELLLALRNTRKRAFVFFNLGIVAEKRGYIPQAEAAYKRAISENPKNPYPPALQNLGHIFLQKGNLTRARSYLVRTIALDPQNAYAHNNLALVLLEKKAPFYNPRDALHHATLAVTLSNEKNENFLYTQALASIARGDRAGAREALDKALVLRPNFAPFLTLRKKCQ